MLAQIFANKWKDIISINKAIGSLQKDGVIDCVEFPSVSQKCDL